MRRGRPTAARSHTDFVSRPRNGGEGVSYTSRQITASPEQAFAVLVDPTTYPRWLIGATAIRDVDETWPSRGSAFHHVVGWGRIRIADSTEVLDIEYGALLRLNVRARPWISAIATFRMFGGDDSCVVTLEEETGP
jgi:uncharacterized protein YndB with AHSA1/START domain